MPRPLLFSAVLLSAQICSADQVDNYLNNQIQSGPVPGIVVTVLKNGKELKTAAYGVANIELDVPATRESVFEAGALSAELTAGGIALLQEAGKLSFDDPISQYLSGTPSAWKEVTIRHCLTHTSGLKSYAFIEGFELRYHLSQQDFIRLIGEYQLEFQPGTKVSYSPTDSTLLAHIIANVSGQSYWSFVEQKILRPLKMTATYDRDPLQIIPNRAGGYVKSKKGGFANRDYDLTDMFGAAGVATTVGDFAKWDSALNDNQLFSEASRQLLWTGGKLESGSAHNNGFIFRVGKLKNRTEYSDIGSTGGFCAAHLRYPELGLSVILMANSSEQNLAPTLARTVAGFYLDQ